MTTTMLGPPPWRLLRLRQVTFDAPARAAIRQAAGRYQMPAPLIASVLADERTRLDVLDRVQDSLMRLSARLPEPASRALLAALEWVCRRPVDSFSLGRAQMKSATLAWLGHLGYLDVPEAPAGRRRMLLDDPLAPTLVAACLRATADHWHARGVSLERRPEILGTLYSLGLTGGRGVHAHPQPSARGQAIADHARWLEGRLTRVRGAAQLPI
ncbi:MULTISPECIES: hypothetical protein [Deinococcus]|uniref:Uncharacterized protein n=1 Tax=Deinococcus rufus TaxID=2136097 RepID=A0ABV7Z9U8_9DEIO|nr:hypothetical protein [Deinococcus sp. AB2017081]WQE97203.1 hypothetical protein U2P90_18275 [Deinococcus sp. AB2017081]